MYPDFVIFAVFVLIYSSVAGVIERTWISGGTLTLTVVCTILLSIILHGISANPWVRGYGER